MRPLRVELEGFSTFRERVVVDLAGLDLVAFTGATGAGKSTLIDAMTFALYGSVPRYARTNLVAPVIHQLANEARVRLDFEIGGTVHLATRVVRRQKPGPDGTERATTREARLERVTGPYPAEGDTASETPLETEVLAGTARELDAEVEGLLGLDFKQFTRTIVLPQGEFAAFLKDDAADRDKLLQRLLDLGVYERMGRKARQEAKRAQQQAEALRGEQARHPVLDHDRMTALSERVERLETARSELEAATTALADLDDRLDPMREQVTEIDHSLTTLAEVGAEVEQVADAGGVESALAERTAALADLEKGMGDLRDRRTAAARAVADLPDKVALVRLSEAVDRLGELEGEAGAEDRRRAGVDARRAELAEMNEAREVAKARGVELQATLREARLAADAAGWSAQLIVGRPCPVCGQEVDVLPGHDPDLELAAIEAEVAEAERAASELATGLAEATAAARAEDAAEERRVEQIAGLGAGIDKLVEDLGLDRRPEPATVAARLASVEEVESAGRSAEQAYAGREQEVAALRREAEDLRAEVDGLRHGLASTQRRLNDLDPPDLDVSERSAGSVVEAARELSRWCRERAAGLNGARAELAAEGKQLAARRAELSGRIADLAGGLGLPARPAGIVVAAVEAGAEARSELREATRRRDEHRERQARIDDLEAERVLNEAMGRHLQSGGFPSWLLAEALDDIVTRATVWLLELSGGQYSLLTRERSFAIIDHNNADERRDVRTLSGGETFLASLALALALAESIAELAPVDAPRLGSMFLDEGFGTLDPATLDTVAAAIEELAATGRMIGIVTHVAELAERMPARFQVTKGPTSSIVELVPA